MIRLIAVGVGVVLLFLILLATSSSFVCHVEDKLSARLDTEVTLWCSR